MLFSRYRAGFPWSLPFVTSYLSQNLIQQLPRVATAFHGVHVRCQKDEEENTATDQKHNVLPYNDADHLFLFSKAFRTTDTQWFHFAELDRSVSGYTFVNSLLPRNRTFAGSPVIVIFGLVLLC